MKFAPYSFSRIDVFQTCARKFKYKYIDKAPKKPQNMEPILKGGAVHHILENYPSPSTHKLAPKYQSVADKFLNTNLGKKLIFRESTREYDLGLTKELKICSYSDKDALFRGSVDYIYFDGGTLHLIDWKTGKRKEIRWQSFDQLMFYAIYFFIKYPNLNTINISYVYVEHPEAQNPLKLERKYLENYEYKLLKAITDIENEEVFAKTTKNIKLCPWCDFEEHCLTDI